MPIDLSCPNRSRHAVLYPEENILEIKCNRGFCGARKGVVVLHQFDLTTGELKQTLKFAEPTRKEHHGSEAALRPA